MSVPPQPGRRAPAAARAAPSGAGRAGWKYGFGEWIGDEIAVGSLTTATTLVADLGVLGRVALTIA